MEGVNGLSLFMFILIFIGCALYIRHLNDIRDKHERLKKMLGEDCYKWLLNGDPKWKG